MLEKMWKAWTIFQKISAIFKICVLKTTTTYFKLNHADFGLLQVLILVVEKKPIYTEQMAVHLTGYWLIHEQKAIVEVCVLPK